MPRRLPMIPTLVVLAAVAVMVRLGFWQIDRMHEKQRLIAQFEAAQAQAPIRMVGGAMPTPYRRVTQECSSTSQPKARAGRNARGEAGWGLSVICVPEDGPPLRVILGWSANFAPVAWSGGEVTGTFLTDPTGNRIVADPPLAGLAANARPDPNDIPNNHWSYAIQWFLFALTALVIYGLALRKRLAVRDAEG